MSTIAVEHGTHLAMKAIPVAQSDSWSFHLPLHRFTAACLREVARRPSSLSGEGEVSMMGIEDLLRKLMLPVAKDDDGGDKEAIELRVFGEERVPESICWRIVSLFMIR